MINHLWDYKINLNQFFIRILLIILFLYFLNIPIINKFVLTFIIIISWIIIISNINNIKKETICTVLFLFLFLTGYGIQLYLVGLTNLRQLLSYIIMPVSFFMVGYFLSKKSRDIYYSCYVIITIGISYAIYAFLSILKTIQIYGYDYISQNSRVIHLIWNSSEYLNATNLGAFVSLGLSLSGIFIMQASNKSEKYIKLLSIIIFLISAYSQFYMANRTSIIIFVVTFLAIFFLAKMKQINVINIIMSILLIIFVYNYNLFDIKNYIENSLLLKRITMNSIFEDLRFLTWKKALKVIFLYPYGGRIGSLPLSYAHNLWLDAGYDAGIIIFIFALIFTLMYVYLFWKLIFKTNISVFVKSIFLATGLSYNLVFFVEPILEGYFYYFLSFCLIVGLVAGLLENYKRSLRKV